MTTKKVFQPKWSFSFTNVPEHDAFDAERERPVHRLDSPERSDDIRHRRHEGAEDVGGDTHEKAVHESALVAAVILHSALKIEVDTWWKPFVSTGWKVRMSLRKW